MEPQSLEADYLVVGCGAMGMGFADALVAESNATVIMIDRRARPGGHWNEAYPFVRLHQPSVFYGANSLALGRDTIDEDGPNRGFYEIASGAEILAYYDQIMVRLIATGRVRWLPESNYLGGGRFVSRHTGVAQRVSVRKAVVDATYSDTQTSRSRPPNFSVSHDARCVPVHALAEIDEPASRYVLIGAGKTAIDACLWLLERGVDPKAIRWVRPREPWLVNRAHVQPGQLIRGTLEGLAVQLQSAAEARDIADLFVRLNAGQHLLRIDETVTPSMYRCATVSQAELAALRRVTQVIRLGRVRGIEAQRIVLEQGTVPTDVGTLHVDCSAPGISRRPALPVFGDGQITLQAVRACQPSFSAALIGHVEASYDEPSIKNSLCTAVPYPEAATDWLKVMLAGSRNEQAWRRDKGLRAWIEASRLHGKQGAPQPASDDALSVRLGQRIRENTMPAMANLARMLAEEETVGEARCLARGGR